MSHKRGDVVLVLFPNSDLRTAKRRPALVVQADNLNTGLPQVIVAMISSNPARRGHPSRIQVPLKSQQAQSSGLKTDSIIMTDNLATIFYSEIDRTIGRWPDAEALDTALRHTLGIH